MLEESAMRRRILALVALATLVVPAAPAMAGGGPVYRFSAIGEGASAYWTTEPADGQPITNVVYTTTTLSTSEGVIREDGSRSFDRHLALIKEVHAYDDAGNYIIISDTFGFADAGNVKFSVSGGLKRAFATATVALSTCTVDGQGNSTCLDTGSGSVVASWTGQGDVVKSPHQLHVHSSDYNETFRDRSAFRQASVSASLNGVDLGLGAHSVFADLSTGSSRTIVICRGSGSC
jgi:hypothetical protein